MNFEKSILSFLGLGSLKYGGNTLSIAALATFILLLPIDLRSPISLMILIAFSPIAVLLISNKRKEYTPKPKIVADKLMLMMMLSSMEFISIDIIRYLIMVLILILSINVPMLEYDINEDKPGVVIIKMSIILILVMFLTITMNLSLVLLKLNDI